MIDPTSFLLGLVVFVGIYAIKSIPTAVKTAGSLRAPVMLAAEEVVVPAVQESAGKIKRFTAWLLTPVVWVCTHVFDRVVANSTIAPVLETVRSIPPHVVTTLQSIPPSVASAARAIPPATAAASIRVAAAVTSASDAVQATASAVQERTVWHAGQFWDVIAALSVHEILAIAATVASVKTVYDYVVKHPQKQKTVGGFMLKRLIAGVLMAPMLFRAAQNIMNVKQYRYLWRRLGISGMLREQQTLVDRLARLEGLQAAHSEENASEAGEVLDAEVRERRTEITVECIPPDVVLQIDEEEVRTALREITYDIAEVARGLKYARDKKEDTEGTLWEYFWRFRSLTDDQRFTVLNWISLCCGLIVLFSWKQDILEWVYGTGKVKESPQEPGVPQPSDAVKTDVAPPVVVGAAKSVPPTQEGPIGDLWASICKKFCSKKVKQALPLAFKKEGIKPCPYSPQAVVAVDCITGKKGALTITYHHAIEPIMSDDGILATDFIYGVPVRTFTAICEPDKKGLPIVGKPVACAASFATDKAALGAVQDTKQSECALGTGEILIWRAGSIVDTVGMYYPKWDLLVLHETENICDWIDYFNLASPHVLTVPLSHAALIGDVRADDWWLLQWVGLQLTYAEYKDKFNFSFYCDEYKTDLDGETFISKTFKLNISEVKGVLLFACIDLQDVHALYRKEMAKKGKNKGKAIDYRVAQAKKAAHHKGGSAGGHKMHSVTDYSAVMSRFDEFLREYKTSQAEAIAMEADIRQRLKSLTRDEIEYLETCSENEFRDFIADVVEMPIKPDIRDSIKQKLGAGKKSVKAPPKNTKKKKQKPAQKGKPEQKELPISDAPAFPNNLKVSQVRVELKDATYMGSGVLVNLGPSDDEESSKSKIRLAMTQHQLLAIGDREIVLIRPRIGKVLEQRTPAFRTTAFGEPEIDEKNDAVLVCVPGNVPKSTHIYNIETLNTKPNGCYSVWIHGCWYDPKTGDHMDFDTCSHNVPAPPPGGKRLEYGASTDRGASGSAVFVYDSKDSTWRCVGIHTGGAKTSNANYGVLINRAFPQNLN